VDTLGSTITKVKINGPNSLLFINLASILQVLGVGHCLKKVRRVVPHIRQYNTITSLALGVISKIETLI
jgi:hypothetical protein